MTRKSFPLQMGYKMAVRGRKPEMDAEVEQVASGLLTDDDYTKLIESLKKKAMDGDPNAQRQMLELHQSQNATKALEFTLNITPYDILDRKLGDIIQQADAPVVMEILQGLSERLRQDEFSRDTQRTLLAFIRQFDTEAERLYAPKED